MEDAFRVAAVWLSLAVAASILAYHLRISMALVEICVGVAAGFFAERYLGEGALGAGIDWLRFLPKHLLPAAKEVPREEPGLQDE